MEESTGRRRHQWMADNILLWEPAVRRWLRRCARTLSCDDIDDLIQESYSRLWRIDFSAIKDGRKFLFTVVSNVLKDQIRHSRVVSIDSVTELESLDTVEVPGPERLVSARQQYERLLAVVEQLPPQRRAVFCARKFEGLSYKQIAQRLGVSERTVDNHLRFAVAEVMQSMLGEEGVACQTSERKHFEQATKRD